MPELAYLNGEFIPISEARIPIEDRGYQFGDAVYEFIVSYNGKLFCLEEHLDRLIRSMTELSFTPIPKEKIRTAVLELFNRSGLKRASIYIQISRGVAVRNHTFSKKLAAQTVMTIRQSKEIPAKYKKTGVALMTLQDFRWGRCDIKTVQILPNALAKQKALDAGKYDAIFVGENGRVREATSANVFILNGEKIITHPSSHDILPGITRCVVINLCRELNIPVQEKFYQIEELYSSTETFLTGSTTEILPVISVDEHAIGDGKVGPITKRLITAFKKRILN